MRLALDNELKLLQKLQDVDLEIDDIHDRSDKLHAELDERETARESLQAGLTQKSEQLEALRTELRDKQRELQENTDHSHVHKDKQARVSSARELSAIEKEIDSLRRRRAQLEEEFENLSDAVTDNQEEVDERQERLKLLEQELAAERKDREKEAAASETRVTQLNKERERIKKSFANAKALVARYEFIRDRLPGRVIVAARNGACNGCNMIVPPQIYNELITGDKVIQCPNCKRILYYEDGAVE